MSMVWSEEISGVVVDAAFWWIGIEDPETPVENVQAVVKMVREFRLKEANG